jgi:hypothetical protein
MNLGETLCPDLAFHFFIQKSFLKLSMVVPSYNSRTQEAEAGRWLSSGPAQDT